MPIKKPAQSLVTVYAPDGTPEKHTLPNARDLLHVGYSWHAHRETNFADPTPAKVRPKTLPTKDIGQEIFDSVGGSVRMGLEEDEAPVEDEDEESEEAAPAPARKQRRPRVAKPQATAPVETPDSDEEASE